MIYLDESGFASSAVTDRQLHAIKRDFGWDARRKREQVWNEFMRLGLLHGDVPEKTSFIM